MDQAQTRVDTQAKAAPKPVRDMGLDVGRGALMAYIITVIHGVFWLGLIPNPPASWLLFEMPPVFVITGAAFFMGERAKGKPSPYPLFISRRVVRIMVPYFAYALVSAALVLAFRATHGHAVSLGEVGASLAAWLNPLTRGGGHTMLMLSWHLWFVPPFLIITALLPFVAPSGFWVWLRPWVLAVGGTLFALAVNWIIPAGPYKETLQNAAVYLPWALFGVALASAPKRYATWEYALVAALAVAAMIAAPMLWPGQASLDMQSNKFPPNAMFFVFSCFWMALLLMAARLVTPAHAAKLAEFPLLKPFVSAGYSIYLWQGLGYSLAAYFGRLAHLSPYVIWLIAVPLTVGLGLLAAPLEQIRVGGGKR